MNLWIEIALGIIGGTIGLVILTVVWDLVARVIPIPPSLYLFAHIKGEK